MSVRGLVIIWVKGCILFLIKHHHKKTKSQEFKSPSCSKFCNGPFFPKSGII
jgi:hypothetical protein